MITVCSDSARLLFSKLLKPVTSCKAGLKLLSTILTDHLHLQPNFLTLKELPEQGLSVI